MLNHSETVFEVVSDEAQQLFATLSHPVALELLVALHEAPAAVSVLAEKLEYEISAISRRLNGLMALGLVRFTRVGRSHIYQLTGAVKLQRPPGRLHLSITTSRGTAVRIGYDLPSP